MNCETNIYAGMLRIDLDDGDWRKWDVRITILYEPDGKMMNDRFAIHAGERIHGVIYEAL